MKNRASALFVDSIYWITYYLSFTVDARVYIETFFQPSKLRNLMVGGLQGEEWKFIQKYLKKNIQKSRWQISGSTKDHFAGENGVCEISQVLKKGCEITSQQQAILAGLRSWISSCGVWLPSRRETSRGISKHCTKRLRNHLATKG